MSYGLNGPANRDEAEYHISAVTLGLGTHVALRELFAIVDSGGRLPEKTPQLEDFTESLGGEFLGGSGSFFRDYPQIDILHDTLENQGMGYEVGGVADMIRDSYAPSVSDFRRLVAANKGICFFRALSRKCSEGSAYPKSGIPAGVGVLAKLIRDAEAA
jgi:hypothetical protein